MMNRGKYIVIEGPEGVGKTTQVNELYRRLKLAKLPVKIFREPATLDDLTARAIRHITQDIQFPVNAKTEVLLYNAARSQTLKIIEKNLNHGISCIVDRNYLSTLAIQYYGRATIKDYQAINKIIEFTVDGIEPDLCVVLDAPVKILRQRMINRNGGDRFDNLDEAFLERVRAGYLWEAQQRNLPVIFCHQPVETVSKQIWDLTAQTLANRKDSSAALRTSEPMAVKSILENSNYPTKLNKIQGENKLLTKSSEGHYEITKDGYEYLQKSITNTTGQIYAFYDYLSPITIAAAMARLSRRGDDLRITLLDEFGNSEENRDQKLLQRVITAYGDDSVQQLSGLHFVIESASNLLTKKLEWGRLAAYLEQSTRYIYYDQKDKNGQFKYYIPLNLKPAIRKQYVKIMDQIFVLYSEMVASLTKHFTQQSKVEAKDRDGAFRSAIKAQACDIARLVLPVATKSTVGIYASGQALESLIHHLKSDELKEAELTGEAILIEARKVIPTFLERADKPDRGGAFEAYRATTNTKMQKLAHKYLDKTYLKKDNVELNLTDYYPRNELDLIPDMLYSSSTQSLEDIREQVKSLSYEQKTEIFKSYVGERLNRRQRPGRALEKAHYSWDIICDYGIFRDLQRHRMVDDLEWQDLTPRFGYEIPPAIEDADLSEQFEKCFDLSLTLYSLLQKNKYPKEAQYATLLGHKMRWKVTYNAREAMHIHELRTSPQGHPGYRKLVSKMHSKLSEIHPLLAESMKFVNQGEDPELSRLAAERYTQFKLKQLKEDRKKN
jgi:dTMP kinase